MIALITDFGSEDYFAGVVKGVIKSINPDVDIIDICHNVKSYSIINAQFILYSSYKYFPEKTIFYVVVDPGVGTNRKALIAQDHRYTYLLPDNGIISSVISDTMQFYEIDIHQFNNISSTFHGRDIFAPIAAKLAKDNQPEKYGKLIMNIVKSEFPEYAIDNNSIKGRIIHIDKFGNIITSIPNDLLELNIIFRIISNGFIFITTSCKTYDDLKADEIGLLLGSSGFIELACNKKPLTDLYNINIGDNIIISKFL